MNNNVNYDEMDEDEMDEDELEAGLKWRVRITNDEIPCSPREWDNLGTMACYHKDYILGDTRRIPGSRYANDNELVLPEWGEDGKHRTMRFSDMDDVFELIRELHQENAFMLPVYFRDYGSSPAQMGIDSDDSLLDRIARYKGDWGTWEEFYYDGNERDYYDFAGVIYIPRWKIEEEYGWKRLTQDRRAKLRKYLTNEIETYEDYINNQVFGIVVEEQVGRYSWEVEDSLWGIYDEHDDWRLPYTTSEARSYAQSKANETGLPVGLYEYRYGDQPGDLIEIVMPKERAVEEAEDDETLDGYDSGEFQCSICMKWVPDEEDGDSQFCNKCTEGE